jgi:hypothetical protein
MTPGTLSALVAYPELPAVPLSGIIVVDPTDKR